MQRGRVPCERFRWLFGGSFSDPKMVVGSTGVGLSGRHTALSSGVAITLEVQQYIAMKLFGFAHTDTKQVTDNYIKGEVRVKLAPPTLNQN